jgi:alcohol dehydrogenase class IV
LALAMGLPADADLAAYFDELNARIGMPRTLGRMGVPEAVLPEMADKAERDHSTPTNPRPVTAADYLRIMQDTM